LKGVSIAPNPVYSETIPGYAWVTYQMVITFFLNLTFGDI